MPTRLFCLVIAVILAAGSAMADDTRMKVVTSFTVLADIAANVAGDAADVASLTVPGAEIHNYEPTPQDIVRALDADLIVVNGLELEAWFQKFLDHVGDVPRVVASDGVELLAIADRDGTVPNPHAWMGLENAAIYVDNLRDAFAASDPANAATYEANAESYKAELRAALEPLRATIAGVQDENRWLVTCEGAFSYLARDLGLRELYLWPVNAEQTGTPQQVRRVIDGVREHRVPAVFCESTVNTAPARQIARETGSRFGGVLYVDSLSDPDGPVPSYIDLLRVTVATIAAGLAGQESE